MARQIRVELNIGKEKRRLRSILSTNSLVGERLRRMMDRRSAGSIRTGVFRTEAYQKDTCLESSTLKRMQIL
jgi:hypothetical protein